MYTGILLPNGKHHITLAYYGLEETLEEYKRAVAAAALAAAISSPFELLFEPETKAFPEGTSWHVRPEFSIDLLSLYSNLQTAKELVDSTDINEFEAYIPHVTLTYFSRKPKNPYKDLTLPVTTISVVSNQFGTTNLRL